MVTALPPAGAGHAARSVTTSTVREATESPTGLHQHDSGLDAPYAVVLVDGQQVTGGGHDRPRSLAFDTEDVDRQDLAVTHFASYVVVHRRRRVAAHRLHRRQHHLWSEGFDRGGFVDGEAADRGSAQPA